MTGEDEEFERIKRRIELETLPLINFTKQKEWVDLTNEQFAEILCDDRWQGRPELMLLQVQAKLKEKNYDRRN